MKKWILTTLFTIALPAMASTFVGNGGNAGDVERAVALQQILGSFQAIAKKQANESLCQCHPQYQNNNLCDSLKALSTDQRLYCAKFLVSISEEAAGTLSGNQVSYSWTNESINVKEGSTLRAVDAVTDPANKKITVRLQRFLDLNDSQRVFLLSHETFHLLKSQGEYLDDQGEIGPFAGLDGKRQLLNAMSASVVMTAYREKLFKKYENTLDRPKAWKHHRIEAGVTGVSVIDTNSDTNAYTNDSMSGGHILYRYQTSSPWGFSIAYKHYSEEKTLLSKTKAQEKLSGGGFGVSYRIFPFDDPLSFLGQSHLVFDFQLEYFDATYSVNDSSVAFEETTSAPGASLDCKYYIPLGIGAWLYLGLGAGYLNYEFKTFGVKYDSLRTQATLGASYGF